MQLLIQSSDGMVSLGLSQSSQLITDTEPAPIEGYDFPNHLSSMMLMEGLQLTDITSIACDIGPGRLSATRAAIAFSNGLAYSSKLPVLGIPSFALVGMTVEDQTGCQALILRRANRDRFHWGLVKQGQVLYQGMTPLSELTRSMPEITETTVIAGDVEKTDLPTPLNQFPILAVTRGSMQCFARLASFMRPESVQLRPLAPVTTA